MCELLGMSANVPTDICFSFKGLRQRGGRTGPHQDGWGVTFYEGKGIRSFKDPSPSAQSPIAALVADYPIKSCAVICHIRQANVGSICLENTHPFSRPLWGINWTYAHNGQLDDNHRQLPVGHFLPVGDTDSERAFCWMLNQLFIKFPEPPACHLDAFREVIKMADKLREFGVFNLLLSDGVYLLAYCSNNLHCITRRAPFGEAKLIDDDMVIDFQKETTPNDVVTVVATQPLTNNEQWEKLQPGQFKLWRLGEEIAL